MTAPTDFEHLPVLLEEVLDVIAPVAAPDEPFTHVDPTLGGAGHATAVLDAHPGAHLLGTDRDPDALAASAPRLERFGARAVLRHGRSDAIAESFDGVRDLLPPVRSVLMDLGVSSHQLDTPGRGFSHRSDGPIDMRFDQSADIPTAADLVNGLPERELRDLLQRYGGERHASRVARGIVAARPITGTTRLAEIVRDSIPMGARRTGRHPARRTFAALRVVVNDETGALEGALDAAIDLIEPGGRVMVISFDSLTDRIVKHRFRREVEGDCSCPPHFPCMCGAAPRARDVARGGLTPGPAELADNPRSASARLRAIEKLVPAEETTP